MSSLFISLLKMLQNLPPRGLTVILNQGESTRVMRTLSTLDCLTSNAPSGSTAASRAKIIKRRIKLFLSLFLFLCAYSYLIQSIMTVAHKGDFETAHLAGIFNGVDILFTAFVDQLFADGFAVGVGVDDDRITKVP